MFLIIQSPSLVTKLAHVILSGQLSQVSEEVSYNSLSIVFISVTLTNQNTDNLPSDSHAFLPPDVNLETKFRQPPAKGYIPAQRTVIATQRFVT